MANKASNRGLPERRKMRMTILEVDPTQRLIHAQGRDGVPVQVSLWEMPTAFRWPVVGEVWSVYYENNFPILGERIQGRVETFKIEDIAQGQVYIDSNTIFDTDGDLVLAAAKPAASVVPPTLLYSSQDNKPFWGPPSAVAAGSVSSHTISGNYTLVVGDTFSILESQDGSPVTVTIPPHSSVAFPINTMVEVYQLGAGQVTIAAGSGVTLLSRGNRFKTVGTNSTIGMRQRATDSWVLSGDLTV